MRTGQHDYHGAVAEFDRLWETGAARSEPERMRQLLQVIDAFEATPDHGATLMTTLPNGPRARCSKASTASSNG